MKRKSQFIISASAAWVMIFSALAQDTPNPNPNPEAERQVDRPDYTRDVMPHTRQPDRLNGVAKASQVIGMTVQNLQEEKLGKVEDVAVDLESGRILQVVLSVGGLPGAGDALIAVPPGALHHHVDGKVLHLNADKEKLKSAPKFEMSKWADFSNSNHLFEIYHYFDQDAAFTFIQNGNSIADQSIPDNQRTADFHRNLDDHSSTISDPNANVTWPKDRISIDRQSMIPASRLADVQKTSKLMGMWIKNVREEKLGKVDDILLDLAAGRIKAVIVSSGGFPGINDELSAVPATAFRYNVKWDTLQLDVTREMLSNARHFRPKQWPEFEQPANVAGFYRGYRIEPYFMADTRIDTKSEARMVDGRTGQDINSNNSNNPGLKTRDRNDQTPPPLDLGSVKTDAAITAQIRKELISTKDLSENARKVEIFAKEGRVTLRGTVDTDEEKRLVGDIADRVAGSGNVDNQLEVKISPVENY